MDEDGQQFRVADPDECEAYECAVEIAWIALQMILSSCSRQSASIEYTFNRKELVVHTRVVGIVNSRHIALADFERGDEFHRHVR
jgi:hypothetical protein